MTSICFLAPDVTKSNLSRPYAFAQLLSRDNEVMIMGPGHSAEPFYKQESGLNLIRLSTTFPIKFAQAWRLARRADVIVACDVRMYSSLIGFIERIGGKRFIFDTGDDEIGLARFEGGWLKSIIPWISAQFRFFAHKVTVASPILHKKYGGVVLPVPVDPFSFSQGNGLTKRNEYCPNSHPVIVYTGTVKATKGVFVLLESMRMVIKKHPRAHLLVVGQIDPIVKKRLSEYMEGLEENVTFTGHVDSQTIPDFLASADMLVLPNLATPVHMAQCPIKLMEYMASGRPVIATAVGCVSEILGRDCGIVIPPGDSEALGEAICRLVSDPELGSRIAEKALDMVRTKYSFEEAGSRIKAIISGSQDSDSTLIDKQVKVSVVVPAHNEERRIANCLESLANQTRKPDEVVVVDSGSTDNTATIAENLGARVISIRPKPPSATRNVGWKSAEGDVIIFGDGDSIFSPTWIERILSSMNEDTPVADARRVHDPNSVYLKSLNANYEINYHHYKPFCAWGFPRRILEETNGFDERLTVSEERDLGERIFESGYDITFRPDAVQFHAGRPRDMVTGWRRNIYHSRERIRYFQLTGKRPLRLLLLWSLLALAIPITYFYPIILPGILLSLLLILFIYHGLARRGLFVTGLRYSFYLPVISIVDNTAFIIGMTWGIWRYMIKRG